MRPLVWIVGCLGLLSTAAHAGVEWSKGLVTAKGVGVANRHAPTAAAARGPARRAADDAAKKQLAAELPSLPLAEGGTLAAKLKDPAIKGRVDRAIEAALVVDADLSTDGSWKVTLGVPLEAIRLAIAGPRAAPKSDTDGPAILVVDGATAKPAIGYKLGKHAAATLWVTDVPAWAKDAPRVKAKSAKSGVIELDDAKGTESTLFVIVVPR